MSYHDENKLAWEEAFENRKDGWGEDILDRIRNEHCPFLHSALAEELKEHDLNGKAVAQFCCNNGRELLSLYQLGAASGVGFDIAENMVGFANRMAQELNFNCSFVATDIKGIDEIYHGKFDYVFVTVGALTWFDNLTAFFGKAFACLNAGGTLVIHETHPVANMLALPGEDGYDQSCPNKLANSYFKLDPWIENNGMGYMSDPSKQYKEVFYSYSHTFAEILNEIIQNNMNIKKLKEYEEDISGSFSELSNIGIPLSYLLVAQK